MTFRSEAFGASIHAPTAIKTAEGLLPSAATLMATSSTAKGKDIIDIDVSINPGTIPTYSAVDVLNGKFDPSVFSDRRVMVSFTRVLRRDTTVSPYNPYTSRAALTIMAAETIGSNKRIYLGWIPAFIVSLLAALAWLLLPRPYGRIIAIVTLVAIVLSPLFLERMPVFEQTSQSIFLLVLLAAAKAWQRVRSLVQEYRTASETKSQFLAQASLPKCDILPSDFDFGAGETLAGKMDMLRQLKSDETSLVVISGHHPDQVHESLPGIDAVVLSKPLRAAELRSALMAARVG
ncbi:MAG TPA: hypothetical protein VLA50_12170 [Erythrobacter sp.]|nr:hypothetical protein [Erythrobacter sp.]